MEKGFLEECLAKEMSLEAIGRERAGKHPSTVRYWLQKHGLAACGAVKTRAQGRAVDARRRLSTLVREGGTD